MKNKKPTSDSRLIEMIKDLAEDNGWEVVDYGGHRNTPDHVTFTFDMKRNS